KAEALLAVLATEPGKVHSRERLATMLWPNSGDEQARGSLRQTLALLRKALTAAGVAGVVAEGEGLSLDPIAGSDDVVHFDTAFLLATPASLTEAIELYRGDFLEGFALPEETFEEWLAQERAHRRQRAIEACEKLLAHCVATSDISAGLKFGERLLR